MNRRNFLVFLPAFAALPAIAGQPKKVNEGENLVPDLTELRVGVYQTHVNYKMVSQRVPGFESLVGDHQLVKGMFFSPVQHIYYQAIQKAVKNGKSIILINRDPDSVNRKTIRIIPLSYGKAPNQAKFPAGGKVGDVPTSNYFYQIIADPIDYEFNTLLDSLKKSSDELIVTDLPFLPEELAELKRFAREKGKAILLTQFGTYSMGQHELSKNDRRISRLIIDHWGFEYPERRYGPPDYLKVLCTERLLRKDFWDSIVYFSFDGNNIDGEFPKCSKTQIIHPVENGSLMI